MIKTTNRKKIAVLLSFMLLTSLLAYLGPNNQTVFGAVSNLAVNAGFEQDGAVTTTPAGWQVNQSDGTVTTQNGGSEGNYSAKLTSTKRTGSFSAPSTGIYQIHTNLVQGTYTLSAKIRTSTPNPSNATQQQAAFLEAKDTGSPEMRAFVNLFAMSSGEWAHVVLRNVLVYNGQATIGIYLQNADVGATLEVDDVSFYLEHSDHNPLKNWSFESGNISDWTKTGAAEAEAVTGHADAGSYALRLGRGAKVTQTVAVKPNTDYIVSARAKVESSNDRIHIGVEGIEESRYAPSATTNYTLLPLSFRTGPAETTASIYVERSLDGTGYGYADSLDLFEIDNTIVKGVDVSFLKVVEDYGGTYKANGVTQDFFDIIRNRGVNAVTSMFFVEAGNYIYDEQQWKDYQAGIREDLPKQTYDITYVNDLAHLGTVSAPLQMIPGYFGKDQALEIGKRAKQNHMKFEVSLHYSDNWMSQAKAWKPLAWFNQNLQQLQTTMYNYTYDFIKTLADEGVAPHSVKLGNEENSGIVWPEGRLYSNDRVGFGKLVNASYQAVKDASPTTQGFLHLNNGYDVDYTNTWYDRNEQNNITWDGEAYSLYGGREIGSIISMLNNNLNRWKGKAVIFSETALAHTRENISPVANGSAMSNKYYEVSQRGQYNWLIEYMQAFRDVPNPYSSEIGFFYWAAEWISKGEGHSEWYSPWIPGGSTSEYGNTIDKRTLFTYDGHASDGLYAYLWRGKAAAKPLTGKLSHSGVSDTYAVEPTPVSGIELAAEDLLLTAGKSGKMIPTVKPINQFAYTNITWTSSDASVAVVDKSGIVTALKAGEATITAVTKDGGFAATRKVVVSAPTLAGSINIAAPSLSGNTPLAAIVGERIKIQAGLTNSPSDNRLIYTSSNPSVASFLGEAAEKQHSGVLIQQLGVTTDVTLMVHQDGESTITIASADGESVRTFVLSSTKIAVTGVQIQSNDSELGVGRSKLLESVVLPQNASFPGVTWKSSDNAIAKVDEKGLVTAIGEGTAVITVTTDEGSLTDTVNVTVVPVKSESLKLNTSLIRLRAGDIQTITASVLPLDAADKSVSWQSSDPSVFTVTGGTVTAVADGEAILTASTSDGGASISVDVIVADNLPVTAIELDHAAITVTAGEYAKLETQIKPAAADNQGVSWTSSDESVATVTGIGEVIAHKQGSAVITVITDDGGFTAQATITVDDRLQLGKTTGASRLRAANPVEFAIDGLSNTAWSPGAGRVNQSDSWWINLGKSAVVNQIDVEFWGASKYVIEVSQDGISYQSVINQTQSFSATNKVSHVLPEGTQAKFVRVVIYETSQAAGTTWPGIVEFNARGKFVEQAKEIVLSETSKTVIMSDQLNLTASLKPSFINEPITWTSSDTNLAEVVAVGNSAQVTTKVHNGEGGEVKQATITAKTASGLSASAVIGIKVPIIVEAIEMYRKDSISIPNDGKIDLVEGAGLALGVSVFQGDADYRPITWVSNTPEVASVDSVTGQVTAHQPGIAEITVIVDSYGNLAGGFSFTQTIELTVKSKPVIPAIPDGVAAVASGLAIAVSWSHVEGADGYHVFRSGEDGEYVQVTQTPIVRSSYQDTELAAGTTYSYVVTAINSAGESAGSSPVSATTELVEVIPAIPDGIAANSKGSNAIEVTWNAVPGASYYQVYRSDAEEGPFVQLDPTEVRDTVLFDSELPPATTFYYKVSARNGAGQSDQSPAVYAATLPEVIANPPAAPALLTASTGLTNSISVQWKSVEEADNYQVYRSDSIDGSYVKLSSSPITGTQYTNDSLASGKTYFYKVTAWNAGGESEKSDAVEGRTVSVTPTPGPTTTPVTEVKPDNRSTELTISDGKLELKAEQNERGVVEVKLTQKDIEDALAKTTGNILQIHVIPNKEGAESVAFQLPVNKLTEQSSQVDKVIFEVNGTVWILDQSVLRQLVGNRDLLTLNIALTSTAELPSAVQEAIGDRTVYEYEAAIDGQVFSSAEVQKLAQIGLPYALSGDEKSHQVVVYQITQDGKLEVVKKAKYDVGTNLISFAPTKIGRYVAVNVEISFADLSQAAWARDVIESLAARQIVNGTGNGLFEPNHSVTRAQFIQMLMNSFDLPNQTSESTFTDVTGDAWYANAVAAAESLGILTGRADGKFDGQATITREEMAALVYRAASKLQLLHGTNESQSFSDASAISGYALEAVKAMQSHGLIKGMGDGRFQPKSVATRTQAAQIIYTFLSLD
ncbi:glycosyl hydrolase 53 family protein [Paenibacillus sinopodophylli]|uniref:glycosyl hydrolase 53 family protein n=1 Tax=Paenibacillus sinopodophylli TaxID=1837342 RepID=UPI00110CB601|nr:glycosyl hydrolase 53 family protein [Paenibacillus sinopodophylli]